MCGVDKQTAGKLTRDHVFPDGLFPPPKPTNLLTLPCCETCQKRFQLDEEYFRNRLASSGQVFLTSEGQSLWKRVLVSVRKTRAMHQEILQNLASIEFKSPGGLYLGKGSGLRIDKKRFDNVLKKIVCGLHYHHSGEIASGGHDVSVYFDPKEPLKDNFKYIHLGQNLGNVVSYRGAIATDSNSSLWWLLFFKSHLAIGVVTEIGNNESKQFNPS